AMAAPTPISAYLHSATMVKAGIFVLARLLVPLGGSDEWTLLIGGVGALTMLTGALLAIFASDLKQVLAYSTVSALGTLVLLIGIGSPAAVQAAIVFLVAHALYKGALFLVVGSIDHGAGTREVELLGGLRRAMPATAIAAIAGALSLAAVAPALSFAAKEMIAGALAEAHPWSDLLKAAVYLTGILLAAIAALIAIGPFFGARRSPAEPHDPSPLMWAPAVVLAGAGIVFGLFPGPLTRSLLAPAAAVVTEGAEGLELFWWHGFAPLVPVAAVIAAGVALFLTRPRWLPRARRYARIGGFGPAAAWRGLLAGAVAFAGWQTRRLQSGYLRIYLMITVLTVIGLVAVAGVAGGLRLGFRWDGDVRFHEIVVAALIVAGGLVAVVSRSRLGSVAALGVVGYSVALVFVLFSAPDLAMTQFLIETLTVILFVLVLYRLPRFAKLTSRLVRIRDAVVAGAAGAVIAALIYAATQETPEAALSRFYAESSLEHAHGRNIVNVILVDFRALDTLGEIAVVAVAAIGVLALLRIRLRPEQGGGA
ncbi:MAG: DUF4040 domain-containing protein, partial [Acidobacteria bacterium]|nr:DUF4040 domain-containing protein [Acidobacteriota bacterium]